MLIYDGEVALVAGEAMVNIDTASGMTAGTFEALSRNRRFFLQNKTGFAAVKPSAIVAGQFTISCEDALSVDTVSWSVQCERQDDYVKHISIADAQDI